MKRRHDSHPARWGAGSVLLVACSDCGERAPPAPSYAEARALVDAHCVACHSEQPRIPAFPIAPSGVLFDTAAQMQQYAERIRLRTLDGSMPLLNKTQMTEHERGVLGRWVSEGASWP